MIRTTFAAATALLALSACTPEEPATQAPTAVSFSVKPGFDQSRILGTETINFVTSTKEQRGAISWDKALAGSTCRAESSEIVVNFTTPAQVALPILRGQPSAMTVSCSNGALQGAVRTQPILIESNESGNLALEQDNIVAGVIFGAIAAGQERREARARDAWRFIEVSQGVSLK